MAGLDQEQLRRLHGRAEKRYLRRKALSERLWTAHVNRYGVHPRPSHSGYERCLALEDDAYRLMTALSRHLYACS